MGFWNKIVKHIKMQEIRQESSICSNVEYSETPMLERGRDSRIWLDEDTHVYHVDDKTDYTSVTTWNHLHFEEFVPHKVVDKMMKGPKFKESEYADMTREEILQKWKDEGQEASRAGTAFHYAIECYYRGLPIDQQVQKSVEWSYFLKFVSSDEHTNDPKITPYKSEWQVFDEDLKLAGTIDMTFVDDQGKILIYDWKRCKKITKINEWQTAITPEIDHLQDCNFWHYALQLNTYKYILEKHYNREVSKMYIVSMHPDNESGTYDKYELPDLQHEIRDLMVVRVDMMRFPNYITSTTEVMKRQAAIISYLAQQNPPKRKLADLIDEFRDREKIDWKFFNEALCQLVKKRVIDVDPQHIWVWYMS